MGETAALDDKTVFERDRLSSSAAFDSRSSSSKAAVEKKKSLKNKKKKVRFSSFLVTKSVTIPTIPGAEA